MRLSKLHAGKFIALAMSSMLALPASVVFATPPQVRWTKTADVALGPEGTLSGQVVNMHGAGQAEAVVSIQQNNREVVRVKSGKDGRFVAKGLSAGLYLVTTKGAAGPIRAWAPRTAPPSASHGVLLVPGQATALGQNGEFLPELLTNPGVWIIGGIIGTVTFFAVEDNDAS